MRKIIFIAAILLYSSAFSVENNYIDWKKGMIIADNSASIKVMENAPANEDTHERISINRGRNHAYNHARDITLNEVYSMIKKVRVDSNSTILDLMESKVIVQSKIANIISEKIKFVEYPVDFFSSACKAILKITDIIPALPYTFPSHEFPNIMDNPIRTKYTSLIIDTRGLNIEPMIFPAVLNEDGLEFYARHFIDPKYASKYGMTAYVYNEDEAMANKRAGDHPFFTTALKSLNGCPVVSNKDMRKILSSPETLVELKKCRVIMIIKRIKVK